MENSINNERQRPGENPHKQRLVVPADCKIQTRRAQTVCEDLSSAIRCVCLETPDILACYLLEARIPDSTETSLIIAVTVNNESRNLGRVAESMQQMLRQFPEEACNTVIMSSSQFVEKYRGSEFYSLKVKKCDY